MANVDKIYGSANGVLEYTAYTNIPYSLLSEELQGLYGNTVLREMKELIQYYKDYEEGVSFISEKYDDGFTASSLRFKLARNLINRQVRFMFAMPPDFRVSIPYDRKRFAQKKVVEQSQSILQKLVDNVLKENQIGRKLVNAAKDCFIAKRVAYVVNFSEDKQRITISFVPSIGFIYETDDEDIDVLTKLVIFYSLNDVSDKKDQRVYKKKYYMENGFCNIIEGVYDGAGDMVGEEQTFKTEFPYIIGGVILNDGLTGDLSGMSEMDQLDNFEATYNKVANSDIDSERKSMNPITYAMDVDPATTDDLSRTPGSFWDLSTDANADEHVSGGRVGVIESAMNYSSPLAATLDRIRASAYETAEVPDVSAKALQGIVSSGKTLKAIYWTLMVRCDEKFLTWKPALQHMLRIIIDGAYLYREASQKYIGDDSLPVIKDYEVDVVNNYPIQDDQTEEKQMDLDEVVGGVRSKKSYMQKWQQLTDDEIQEELVQMAKERQMSETGFFPDVDISDFAKQEKDSAVE